MADELNLGPELADIASEEVARELFRLTQNFLKNQELILKKMEAVLDLSVMDQQIARHGYVSISRSLYDEAYERINEIGELIRESGEVEYMVGIIDTIGGKAYQVHMTRAQFGEYMKKQTKGLVLSRSLFKLVEEGRVESEEISETFFIYRDTIKSICQARGYDFNEGYVFESYGLYSKYGSFGTSGRDKNKMFRAYYGSRSNNLAWTTGGDIGNLQYKAITKGFSKKSGRAQMSTATISRSKTINQMMYLLRDYIEAAQDSLNITDETLQELIMGLKENFSQITGDVSQATVDLAMKLVRENLTM